MALLTYSSLSTLLSLYPCEPLSVFSSCLRLFFPSRFQDSILLSVPNWLLLFPQPFSTSSTLLAWWSLSNLWPLPMVSQSVLPSSPRHHSPCILNTLTSVCPALASVSPVSMNGANQSAKPESWNQAFWFLSLKVPHPFSHPILNHNSVGFSCLLLSNLHCPLFSS